MRGRGGGMYLKALKPLDRPAGEECSLALRMSAAFPVKPFSAIFMLQYASLCRNVIFTSLIVFQSRAHFVMINSSSSFQDGLGSALRKASTLLASANSTNTEPFMTTNASAMLNSGIK